jgi:transposase
MTIMNNGKKTQSSFAAEQKESLIKRMFHPENITVPQLAMETGISKSTLATWKNKARQVGQVKNININSNKELSSREKFLVVMETYSLPEIKLSEYCRSKGLYVEHVKKWREACMNSNGQEHEISKELKVELLEEKKRSKSLEKELNRKDKALAETAALLVLRKKLGAIFGDQEEE